MDENTFFTKDGNLKEKIEIPDYFILFNLQKKYSLDAKELEKQRMEKRNSKNTGKDFLNEIINL